MIKNSNQHFHAKIVAVNRKINKGCVGMSENLRIRFNKKWKETFYYMFPTMGLRDTLIFVGVCTAAGFVFDNGLNWAFGIISVFMIVHYIVYSIAKNYYIQKELDE